MGGRSRKPKDDLRSKYEFVRDLTDQRLINYGRYTSAGIQNFNDSSITQSGMPANTIVFNGHLSEEYKRRFGQSPDWDLSTFDYKTGRAKAAVNRARVAHEDVHGAGTFPMGPGRKQPTQK